MEISERSPVSWWRFLYAVGSDLVYILRCRFPKSPVRGDVIVHVIRSLGRRRRLVLVLRQFRHMSFVGVAARTGMSKRGVYQLNQSATGSVGRRLSLHGVELMPSGDCGGPRPGRPPFRAVGYAKAA